MNNLAITGVPDASNQLSMYWLIGSGEDFEDILIIFGHEGHACHMIPTVWANICSFRSQKTTRNLVTTSPVAFEDRDV